jgi:choice-of-anchor B domain-containing protein
MAQAASHNVVSFEEREIGVAVGTRPTLDECKGGLIFFDLKDPSNPTRLGCNGDDGYVHDAQCLVYRGPHEKYVGRDICYGYNEDSLTIYDITDRANSTIISITSYEGATYTHQGWVLDTQWQEYLVMDDEIDEIESRGPAEDKYPVTYIWDIRDLENPKQTGLYKGLCSRNSCEELELVPS